jgi:hypothetical protein
MSDENNAGTPEVVELAKYNKAKEETRKAHERIKELEPLAARVAELEPLAAKATELEGKLAEITAAREADTARWGEELALAEVGLADQLGRDVARAVYQRLPEQDRPTLPDFARGLSKEGADIPKPLQPYFTRPAAAVTPPARVEPPNPAGKPAVTGADGTSIGRMLADAQAAYRRTGDAKALEAAMTRYRESVNKSTGRP